MPAADILDTYRRTCLQPVTIRRYSGSAPRTSHDYTGMGNARLYGAAELTGSIKQGDWRVIVIVADLVDAGLALPVTTNDRVVVKGQELKVMVPAERSALEGDLIAYEITARG